MITYDKSKNIILKEVFTEHFLKDITKDKKSSEQISFFENKEEDINDTKSFSLKLVALFFYFVSIYKLFSLL